MAPTLRPRVRPPLEIIKNHIKSNSRITKSREKPSPRIRKPKASFPFLALPAEIRNQIYPLVVKQKKPIHISKLSTACPLAAVCQQIRSESLSLFLGVNTFRLTSLNYEQYPWSTRLHPGLTFGSFARSLVFEVQPIDPIAYAARGLCERPWTKRPRRGKPVPFYHSHPFHIKLGKNHQTIELSTSSAPWGLKVTNGFERELNRVERKARFDFDDLIHVAHLIGTPGHALDDLDRRPIFDRLEKVPREGVGGRRYVVAVLKARGKPLSNKTSKKSWKPPKSLPSPASKI